MTMMIIMIIIIIIIIIIMITTIMKVTTLTTTIFQCLHYCNITQNGPKVTQRTSRNRQV